MEKHTTGPAEEGSTRSVRLYATEGFRRWRPTLLNDSGSFALLFSRLKENMGDSDLLREILLINPLCFIPIETITESACTCQENDVERECERENER